jgi:hypothetical protein
VHRPCRSGRESGASSVKGKESGASSVDCKESAAYSVWNNVRGVTVRRGQSSFRQAAMSMRFNALRHLAPLLVDGLR